MYTVNKELNKRRKQTGYYPSISVMDLDTWMYFWMHLVMDRVASSLYIVSLAAVLQCPGFSESPDIGVTEAKPKKPWLYIRIRAAYVDWTYPLMRTLEKGTWWLKPQPKTHKLTGCSKLTRLNISVCCLPRQPEFCQNWIYFVKKISLLYSYLQHMNHQYLWERPFKDHMTALNDMADKQVCEVTPNATLPSHRLHNYLHCKQQEWQLIRAHFAIVSMLSECRKFV